MLDSSFNSNGKKTIDFGGSTDNGYDVAVDSQDRVLVAGETHNISTAGYDYGVVRVTTAGDLDTSFSFDGRQTVDFGTASDIGQAVAVDSQDRVVLAGRTYGVASGYDFGVARLNTAGALDSSFDLDGRQTVDFGNTTDYAQSVAIDNQDRIVVAGYSGQPAPTGYDFALVRLLGDSITSGTTTVDYSVTGSGIALADADDSEECFPVAAVTFSCPMRPPRSSQSTSVAISSWSKTSSSRSHCQIHLQMRIPLTSTAGTILNDDSATVSISSESKVEGTGGTTNYVFSVDLSNPVDVAVSMTADTADGSATAADDYTAVAAAPVGFGVADTTTQTVTVSVAADAKVELDEAFDLVLSSLSAGGRTVTFAGAGITESATADVLQRRQRDRVDLVRVEGRGDRRDDELCVQRRPVQPGGRGGFDDGRHGRRLGHRRGRLHGRGRSPSRLRRGGYDDADGDGQRGGGRQGGAGRGLRPGA